MTIPPDVQRRPGLGHIVERLTVDVTVAEAGAPHALLERIGEANRARWLPLIERIFDEFDRPGEVIRIDRIELDLGRFSEAGIDAADARLEVALRAALRRAVPPPSVFPGQEAMAASEGVERLGVGAALLEALEHWLLHGTWPYGAGLDPATAPAGLLERLIEDEPGGLVAMLRRRGRSEPLLRRLVLQIPEALLERLLHRLEPESAAWILGYVAETRAAHAAEPLVEASPDAFARTLWEIVLRDALNRAGLRSNRRSFVARLIGDLASTAGLTFAALVRQLSAGLRSVPQVAAGADTLLSILSELGEGSDWDGTGRRTGDCEPLGFEALARLLEGRRRPAGAADGRQAVAAAIEFYPAETGLLLRRLIASEAGALPDRLEGLVSASALFRALLPEAEAAALALRYEQAGGACARSELLRLAACASGPDPASAEAGDGAEAAALALRYEQAGGAGARSEPLRLAAGASGPDPASAEARDALGRLAKWLAEGGSAAKEKTAPASPFLADLEAAEAEDPVGTRRLLRRFARADAGRLLKRLGSAAGPARAARWLLPPGTAAEAAAFLRQARCSAGESALLLGLATAMPASAPPALLVKHWLAALAARRGERPERLAEQLGRLASAAGGEDKRLLARLLPSRRGSGRRRAERLRAARRHRAIGLLSALLRGRPVRFAESVVEGLGDAGEAIAAIAAGAPGTEPHLHSGSRLYPGDLPADPEAALRRLDPVALRSLIALLAPRSGAARDRLRRFVSGKRDSPALARIAARLLAGRAIGVPAGSDPAPRAEPLAAALQVVEAALARGGSALDEAGFRSAAALLVRRRPALLPTMLAANPRRGAAAAARLAAHPDGVRLLFAGFPEKARGEAAALARSLAGPGGIGARTLAASLPGAPGRGTEDPVAAWIGRLRRLATAAERQRLDRLLGPGPRAPSNPAARRPAAIARRPSSAPAPAPRSSPPKRTQAPVSRHRRTEPRLLSEPGSTEWLRAAAGRGGASSAAARAALRSSDARRRLARNDSRELLARLLLEARPAEARALLDAADSAAEAIRAHGGSLAAADLREAVLDAAARSGPGGAVEALLERLLTLHVATRYREAVARRLLDRARADGRGALASAVEDWLYDSAPRPGTRRRPARAGEDEAGPRRESKLGEPVPFPEGRAIAVANAGLVLAGAYLPQLFARLGLVARGADGRLGWISAESADRAVHLLQFLADERCDAPEPALALNKLLCGLDPAEPALPFIVITDAERAICESLLEAMLGNWPMLRDSSTAALRETFLQRQGRLVRGEGGWKLQVERKVLDILLDDLPWSFAMIFNAWMPEPLSVDW